MKFEVTTTEKKHRFSIATDFNIHFNENGPSIMKVFGDDDYEDGEVILHYFNMDYVVDFGWV